MARLRIVSLTRVHGPIGAGLACKLCSEPNAASDKVQDVEIDGYRYTVHEGCLLRIGPMNDVTMGDEWETADG